MGASSDPSTQVLPPQSSPTDRGAAVIRREAQCWPPVKDQPAGDRFYALPRTDGTFALCDRRLPKLEQMREAFATLAELKAAIAKLPPDDAS